MGADDGGEISSPFLPSPVEREGVFSVPLTLGPLPRGEGTLNGGFVAALPHWIPACAGKTVRGGFAVGVGEAVLD